MGSREVLLGEMKSLRSEVALLGFRVRRLTKRIAMEALLSEPALSTIECAAGVESMLKARAGIICAFL